MCINKMEMEKKLEEIKSLKRLKEEVEAEISALERDIIGYLSEVPECATTNKQGKPILQYIGSVFKATYSEQTRETLDKEKAREILMVDDYEAIKKVSTYNVLRIS